ADKSSVQFLVWERFRYTFGLQVPHDDKGAVAIFPGGCGEQVFPRHESGFPAGIGVTRVRTERDADLHDITGRESLERGFAHADRREMAGRALLDRLAQSVVVDPPPPAAQHVMPVLGQALHTGATDCDRYPLRVACNVQENGRHGYAPTCDNLGGVPGSL